MLGRPKIVVDEGTQWKDALEELQRANIQMRKKV